MVQWSLGLASQSTVTVAILVALSILALQRNSHCRRFRQKRRSKRCWPISDRYTSPVLCSAERRFQTQKIPCKVYSFLSSLLTLCLPLHSVAQLSIHLCSLLSLCNAGLARALKLNQALEPSHLLAWVMLKSLSPSVASIIPLRDLDTDCLGEH
jgi:hypothetical protein